MGDLSKEIPWHKSPAPIILATRRRPDESIQNTHREKGNWLLLLSLDTQGQTDIQLDEEVTSPHFTKVTDFLHSSGPRHPEHKKMQKTSI